MVEVISHCHTQFGLKNKLGGPVEMMRAQKEMAVRVEKARTMTPEELAGKITIGVLVDRDLPIYTQEYRRIREAAKAALGEKIVLGEDRGTQFPAFPKPPSNPLYVTWEGGAYGHDFPRKNIRDWGRGFGEGVRAIGPCPLSKEFAWRATKSGWPGPAGRV